jgi:hypothetical protein
MVAVPARLSWQPERTPDEKVDPAPHVAVRDCRLIPEGPENPAEIEAWKMPLLTPLTENCAGWGLSPARRTP